MAHCYGRCCWLLPVILYAVDAVTCCMMQWWNNGRLSFRWSVEHDWGSGLGAAGWFHPPMSYSQGRGDMVQCFEFATKPGGTSQTQKSRTKSEESDIPVALCLSSFIRIQIPQTFSTSRCQFPVLPKWPHPGHCEVGWPVGPYAGKKSTEQLVCLSPAE